MRAKQFFWHLLFAKKMINKTSQFDLPSDPEEGSHEKIPLLDVI